MDRFKSISVYLMLLLAIATYLPGKIYPQETVQKAKRSVTEYKPESSATDEEKIPTEKSGSKWLWILIGVALAGGAAAVALGGSGSDSSDGGGGSNNQTDGGSYETQW